MPLLELFTSHIQSPLIGYRHREAAALRILAPYRVTVYDIASDHVARARFRSKNQGNTELPCLLVNGVRVGDMEDLQIACAQLIWISGDHIRSCAHSADQGQLKEYLRLDIPQSSLNADDDDDDDLESLSDAQVDELLASFDKEREEQNHMSAVTLPMTPPETPKTDSIEKLGEQSSRPASRPDWARHVVAPYTPPMTPESLHNASFSVSSANQVLQDASRNSPRNQLLEAVVGSPSLHKEHDEERTSPVRTTKPKLPQVPLRTPKSHSPTSSVSSSGSHRSRATLGSRTAFQPLQVQRTVSQGQGSHKSQNSLADLCAAIDDAISESSAGSPIGAKAELSYPGKPPKEMLLVSPAMSAASRPTAPPSLDMPGVSAVQAPASGSAHVEVDRKAEDMGQPCQMPRSVLPMKQKNTGSFFACFSPKHAGSAFEA